MSLESTLTDITSRLRQGRFPNEQAISQGIVLRVLQELRWDTWDTNIVWPEYQTGEGRVDFALCHPASKPAVFIEVKQPGKAEDGIRQALEYAFHTGVPFVVLTDGKTWSFYLPAEQGSYEERRVYKLDLFERDAAHAADVLGRYLMRAKVEGGEALETARKEYRSRNRRSHARSAIPGAWRELVEKGDERLVEMLIEAVESKAGFPPDEEDVAAFLNALSVHVPAQPLPNARARSESQVAAVVHNPAPEDTAIPPATTRSGTLVIKGKRFPYANAKDAMIKVLVELSKADPSFLQRCSQHPDAQGTRRRYIAKTAEELYPNRPDLRHFREELPDGWLVATNLNNGLKRAIIRFAAEVAGLAFGKDVVVEF